MSLPIGSFVGVPGASAQDAASKKRKVPVPTRVGPLTRRGGGTDIFLGGDAGAPAPAVFLAGRGAAAGAEHFSKLRQRGLPGGGGSPSRPAPNDPPPASSALAGGQPSATPRAQG